MPHTFSLPDELGLFREYLSQQQQQQQQQQLQGRSCSDRDAAGHPASESSVDVCSSKGAKDTPPPPPPPAEDLWILKTAQHLGKGLKLTTAREAGEEAGRRK